MSVAHWENYYRGGAIASCPMGPSSTYTLELRDLWLAFFAQLEDGAAILDVGTGNGAIPLLAKEAAAGTGKRFDIHGADLAAINPAGHVQGGATLFAGIVFHPGMRTERLGFGPATFDAVTGQYSLEYADIDRALAEVRRVLKPGASALFVLHHDQSVPVRNARESLLHGALVLEETKIFRSLRRHVVAERESATAARITWESLSAADTRLRQAAASSANPHLLHVVIDGVQKLLSMRHQATPAALEREIDRFESDVRAGLRRLQDLVGCAQSAGQMDAIVAVARRLGFECDAAQPQLHAGQNLVGWRLALANP